MVSKDIVKQMKAALTDKSLPVQRAAAVVHIFVMFVVSPNSFVFQVFDAIVAQCTKSLDSADQVTRHTHAQLAGHPIGKKAYG